jgi:hypothetical protein
MIKLLTKLSTMLILLFTANIYSMEETVQDNITGISFPKKISFDHEGKNYSLDVTGIATRTKLIVKVYSIAHYMEPMSNEKAKGDIFEQILDSKKAKQFTTVWLRNIEADKIISGYIESFEKVLGPNTSSMQKQIDQYLSFFGGVHANDQHIIRWIPDGSIVVYINKEKKGVIKDEKFARVLWSVWFGKNSVVKRDNLVSFLK